MTEQEIQKLGDYLSKKRDEYVKVCGILEVLPKLTTQPSEETALELLTVLNNLYLRGVTDTIDQLEKNGYL